MKKSHWPYFLIVFAVFLLLISPKQWADGMFLDGMLYATIARNMANGLGSFWTPQYTASWNHFYEHPPLAFWLQGLLFRIIGDSIYVERIYSFLTFIITGGIMMLIWKKVTGKYSNGWIALLFWVITPTVFWACSNNMLEGTMMVFTSLALYFYLWRDKGFYFLIGSGLMIYLALLSKGVFAFFVWSIPFWLYVVRKEMSFIKMVSDSIIIILFTLLPLFLIVKFDPDASQNLNGYWTNQVVGSVENVQTVPHRFTVIVKMFNDLLPALGISVTFFIVQYFRKKPVSLVKNYSWPLFFLLVALSGVLPIMVSMKQRSFYILATFPFFSLSFGLLLRSQLDVLMDKIKDNSWEWIKRASLILCGFALVISFFLSGRIARDKDELHDVYAFLEIIPRDSIVGLTLDLSSKYEAYAMFGRYGNVTLIPGLEDKYLIARKGNVEIPKGYRKISNTTYYYDLYENYQDNEQ